MFKNSSGKWFTKALFFELTPAKRPHAMFTLKEEDHIDGKTGKTYVSLKRLFLESDDPTEYEFATQHLGGWSHWKELCNNETLAPVIEEWREERDVMLRSVGVKSMVKLAKEEGNFQASKYLADKGWAEGRKAGRPTKAEIKKAAREQAAVKSNTSNDLNRLRNMGIV